MKNYSKEELDAALQLILSTISKCEIMQLKFEEGTPQHSLLRNRIRALYISKGLIEDVTNSHYTLSDLEKALPPILSIIRKSEKAQLKCTLGTAQYKRLDALISTMYISKTFIEKEIVKQRD